MDAVPLRRPLTILLMFKNRAPFVYGSRADVADLRALMQGR
jgi:hypothetical protein